MPSRRCFYLLQRRKAADHTGQLEITVGGEVLSAALLVAIPASSTIPFYFEWVGSFGLLDEAEVAIFLGQNGDVGALDASVAQNGCRGRADIYWQLRPLLEWNSTPTGKTEEIAAACGLSPNAVRVALKRLRQAWRARLEQAVAQTVAQDSEVAEEVRYVCGLLASAPQG